jgi:hypothetical protein
MIVRTKQQLAGCCTTVSMDGFLMKIHTTKISVIVLKKILVIGVVLL